MTLKTLPDIQFCETDTANVETAVIVEYESLAGKKLYPGDPVRLFLEALAKMIVMQRVIIDTSAKQNLLAFATDEKLDHLGALTGTTRLAPTPATAVFRFSALDAAASSVLIPAGIRVTLDQELFFATVETCEIPAGDTFAEVQAECTDAGEIGNGFLPGQVNRLVDAVDGVDAVENITETADGADTESDDSFRERIHLSVERYTTAGTRGGYEYWAKTAHQDIVDVAVHSPDPGIVDVYVLLNGGLLPDQEMLDLVESVLTPEDVIPLTDTCNVKVPEPVSCSVELTWYLDRDDSALAGSVQAAVLAAVDEYAAWQTTALGRDINPTELIWRVKDAGATRVSLTTPVHVYLELWQVALVESITVIYGGLE